MTGALLTEDVAAVATVMLTVESGEGGTATHAYFAVNPLWRSQGFDEGCCCGGVGIERRKIEVVVALELLIDVGDVAHVGRLCLCDLRPVLDQAERLALDVVVDAGWIAKDRDEVVHELARCDFLEEVVAAVLDADIGESKSKENDVGVLVADAALKDLHRLLGWDLFCTHLVADLEVEGDVF